MGVPIFEEVSRRWVMLFMMTQWWLSHEKTPESEKNVVLREIVFGQKMLILTIQKFVCFKKVIFVLFFKFVLAQEYVQNFCIFDKKYFHFLFVQKRNFLYKVKKEKILRKI